MIYAAALLIAFAIGVPVVIRLLALPIDRARRQRGERCETCHWCNVVGDEPSDEPNGYCLEPGTAAANHPYAGEFVNTQSWCRMWQPETADAVDPHAGSTPV
jgi:hypothetical protein